MNHDYMREALELARQGLGQTSPNPAVGAIIVRDGEICGSGFHTYAGVKHAEIVALDAAGDKARGATMYVTLEPCCHQGRTGPCSKAIIDAGISRVVAAMEDPNPKVSGAGLRELAAAGVDVYLAHEFRAEAERLNESFVHFMRHQRPLVFLKSAVTLDGKIAAPEDNSGWITSEKARLHVQTIRHESDTILTGIGTVLGDDPLMTDRSGFARQRPLLRIVLDSQLRIPVTSRIVESSRNDLLVVTTSAASPARQKELEAHGVEVMMLDGRDGRTDLPALVKRLAERCYLSVMIEAGSKVNWAALESGIVDKIFFYYAPKILGGMQSLPVAGGTGRRRRVDAIRFRDVHLHQITADEFAVEAWMVKEQ